MAVQSPPFALGAAGQVLSGRTLRHAVGAAWLPGAGITGISGCLAGPANSMGELSLAGAVLTVQAFRAVIQNAQDATAGQYVLTNDAPVAFTMTAQHATQYRRSLVVARVDDSQTAGVASSATTDRGALEVLDGGLAASAGATVLPTPAGSWLALGEVLIPPTGQTITVTPYNPRTTVRGGILPVVNDAQTIPGHAGAAGAHDGAYRHHPARGLEQYETAAVKWRAPRLRRPGARVPFVTQAGMPLNQEVWLGAWSAVADYDTDGIFVPVDRGFTIPAGMGGLWRFEYVGYVTGGTDQSIWLDRLIRYTGTRPANLAIPPSANQLTWQPTRIWATQTRVGTRWEGPVLEGDKIAAWYVTTSAAAVNWGGFQNAYGGYFLAEYVGPNPATA